eukprot:2429951-Alexandrium_andersonii.AAC.1
MRFHRRLGGLEVVETQLFNNFVTISTIAGPDHAELCRSASVELSGALWSSLQLSGDLCSCLELSGTPWGSLELSGAPWSFFELSGALWNSL